MTQHDPWRSLNQFYNNHVINEDSILIRRTMREAASAYEREGMVALPAPAMIVSAVKP